ncbi:amidohydrolase family protein [Psychroflexus sp. CAK1W]|uniref:amidohydrolase family protein n=1 Tax=Psychroflexus curvus TaxID=2873595 RepID=UPI001CCA3D42|nr:amidohydrolase family protein [Psychroflexus curvus]MBZ9628820.1 amidohydrolase family protein [Psychroflexus curvus]
MLIFFISCNNSDNTNPEYTVYQGATLFDGTGKKIDSSIIIINKGRIEAVGDENTAIPDNAEIIDITGKYITPGLIDAHVHLSATGLFDTRPGQAKEKYLDSLNYYLSAKAWTKNNVEKYYEAYLRSGVTGVYDTGGAPWTISLQETAENDLNAPHVAASGTLITPASEEFVNSINPPVEKEMIRLTSDSLGRKVVQYNTYLGSTGIKIWGLALEDEEFMSRMEAVADEVEKLGNKLIIHTHVLDDAKAALQLGAKLLVHGVSHKVVDEEFINLFKKNNALYTPNIGWKKASIYSMEALIGEAGDIEDPNQVLDERTRRFIQSPGEYISSLDTTGVQEGIKGLRSEEFKKGHDSIPMLNLKKLWEAGVTIVVGTDAGNPGMLHGISYYDELEKMQEAGIPASDLIVMATRNGAMAMERLNDIGTLEKGKMADLIILEKDPSEDISNIRSITHVMRGGLLRPVNEKFEK